MSKSQCFIHIALYVFTTKDKRVCLKLLNKQIAARALGLWLPFFPPFLRRSKIVSSISNYDDSSDIYDSEYSQDSATLFEFRDETTILQEWFKTRALHTLVGFESNMKDGCDSSHFNFILSNGTRSTQRDKRYPTDHTHMIPKDAIKKIRSVTIHYYNDGIYGFSFLDKDGALLYKIGLT